MPQEMPDARQFLLTLAACHMARSGHVGAVVEVCPL